VSDQSETGVSENEKVELAKALLAIRSIASDSDFQKIRDILVPGAAQGAVDQAVRGMSEEDEFALMCRLMGTATHLVHQEQRFVIDGDYLVPDFLARFQPGSITLRKSREDSRAIRCFVEVKSTENDVFKIGGQKLRRLRAFADQFGFPLVFAVRFLRFGQYALWVMVEDCRSGNSLKINYGHMSKGVRHILWDDCFYCVNPWISFREIYDTAGSDESGYKHATWGSLQEFHIVSDSAHPITGPGDVEDTAIFTGLDAAMFSIFFECFGLEGSQPEQKGTVTSTVFRPRFPCSIADMLYLMNRLPRDEHGRAILNASRVLAGADRAPAITRTFIESIVKMVGVAALHTLAFGPPDEQLQKWQRFGGT